MRIIEEDSRAGGARLGNETLIQPKYFLINEATEATLVIYDYRSPDAVLDQKFQVLLNGLNLGSCSTKDGFLLRVSLPLGTYRVSLQVGRGQTAIKTEVRIDRRGEYGLRVLISPRYLAFDEVFYTSATSESPNA